MLDLLTNAGSQTRILDVQAERADIDAVVVSVYRNLTKECGSAVDGTQTR